MTDDGSRLIEHAFPLKQASLDSVHEKNVRHGHISTLHIWPARRPLAACRAALIATLLPDPGTPEARKKLVEKIGGTVVKKIERKKIGGKTVEVEREETVGGVLHWGRESAPAMEEFRAEIRKAYGGRAPKVLDPFAGGGAIPLEAMRLGCEVTAIDINPVAWFILKCTLEYAQKLAGQHRPLPQFALESAEFMETFFKGIGKLTKSQLERNLQAVQSRLFPAPDVDLAWHVRAWGWWVLQKAKVDLERFYPTIDGKPTVAYLWARTVTCKNCRATVPLLKTRWLCKKDKKRVLLTMSPTSDKSGVVFGVESDVSVVGGNPAQRREHDKQIGGGTMSRAGATCPCCGGIMTMEDLRLEGQAGRIGAAMTAVVIDVEGVKDYRVPTPADIEASAILDEELGRVFDRVPGGVPDEPLPGKEALGFRVPLYGFTSWSQLFLRRQLVAVGVFVGHIRAARGALEAAGYPNAWMTTVSAYLAMSLDRLVDRSSSLCQPDPTPTQSGVVHTFHRFALPMNWDFIEGVTVGASSGSFSGAVEWVAKVVEKLQGGDGNGSAVVRQGSAASTSLGTADVVVTDPPYYDAIAYADLMDFFYVWLRRVLEGSPEGDLSFAEALSPKWDAEQQDGELIDDSSRFGGDRSKSKAAYEQGMARVFQSCWRALRPDGRLVIVFAHKQPLAWESLVKAMIKSGFVVDGSWPIQTEMANRTRALSSAALSSSVWLVCKKRPESARPGWDNLVLEEMRANIHDRLREFWDAGIRGPDFVWAATGPALESYSTHTVVRKANEPGETMEVSEFLRAVRRIVVDFVVGRVLSLNGGGQAETGLDDVTTYYLLHRNDFGLGDAPSGACILYAVSCNLSDKDLADRYEVLVRTGGQTDETEDDEGAEPDEVESEAEEGTGSKVKLRAWHQRKRKSMGYDGEGAPAPMIDQTHRLMHLWKAGDLARVNEYVDSRALRRNALFHQLLQALIELAPAGSEERSLLESISNHLASRGPVAEKVQMDLPA